ncbi:MAG: GxGYxYP domain-containing protein [Candidatus Helarchaeota archaeon]
MNYQKVLFYIIFVFGLVIATILPFFLSISIADYSHENWNNRNLASNITGDSLYYNNTYFNFKSPKHLNVFDVRTNNYNIQVLLTTLQGLVNRKNVSLFLIYRESDLFWLKQLKKLHNVSYTILNGTFLDVISLYNNSIEGLVIYDRNFLATVNVATFIAGINNCIVIDNTLISNLSTIGIHNIKYDLREQFYSNVDLYSWAWKNFNQFATKKMVCSLDPTKPYFRDYIVATKMFTFYLQGGPLGSIEEINLLKYILSQYPNNIPVFGWFTDPAGPLGEYESVKILSKLGKYSLCAAIPDLTVFSSIKNVSLKQKYNAFNLSDYKIEDKVYITFIVSDGDNVNYCSDKLLEYWNDPNRGAVPIGITLEPAMFKIFPTSLEFYYQNATNNEYFIAGPSGAGYCYVDLNPAFPQFLNQSKYAMTMADMHQVWLLNGYESYQLKYSSNVINAYSSNNLNITGIYLNYHDFPAELNYLSNNIPVFQSIFVERENEILGKLQSINLVRHGPTFIFIGYWAWDFSFTKIKNVVNQLGDDFVILRPDQFSKIYLKYRSSLNNRSMNELITFIIYGIIPLISVASGLVLFWYFYSFKKKIEDIKEIKMDILNKLIFFSVDTQFLLIIRMCFYSTILNLFYFLIFMIGLTIGIYLKKYLDRLFGNKVNLINALILFVIGGILFYFSPKLIFCSGISIGILLNHQIQFNSSGFNGKNHGKIKSFIYSIVFASALILLFPIEYYPYLFLILIILSFLFIILGIKSFIKYQDKVILTQVDNIKNWYFKGVFLGLLLFLLISPTFAPQRLFYYLFWGTENFPTNLSLSFLLSALYLVGILILELLEIYDIKIKNKKYLIIIFVIGIVLYILMPLIANGILFFVLSFSIFIIGILLIIDYFFNNFKFIRIGVSNNFIAEKKGLSGFTAQLSFWLMIGLFLIFVPPSIIIADTQDIFATIGISSIGQITWPSYFWAFFYIPPIQYILIIPTTIGILIYGIISLFI